MRNRKREETSSVTGPVRRCVGCGTRRSKDEFLRVLRGADGAVTIDVSCRGNGRGAYLCKDPACLKRAEKNRGLERALGIVIPEDVRERLHKEMDSIENI